MTAPAGMEQRLQAWGIRRPAITIRAARDSGLELAAACVVLMHESGGGRMVWGSDGKTARPPYRRTDAAGQVIYEFGGPVTQANYLRYRDAMRAGLIKRQGVGDCQLTSAEYQDRGDQLGGCWDPYANQKAGFTGLGWLIKRYGDRQGFRRYNGSGPAAEDYADRAMVELAKWRTRLGSSTSTATAAVPVADTRDEVEMATVAELQKIVADQLRELVPGLVWNAPIPDYYQAAQPGQPAPTLPAFAAAGWAATSSAQARDQAAAANAAAAQVVAALAHLPAQLEELVRGRVSGTLPASGAPAAVLTAEDVRALLREALAQVGPLRLVAMNPTP